MGHIKIYIVSIHYLYKDLDGKYTPAIIDYYTPYLYTNQNRAKGFISRIIERWKNEGFDIAKEPSDLNEKLSNFHKCIWEFINIVSDEKRVIILDPTLTEE